MDPEKTAWEYVATLEQAIRTHRDSASAARTVGVYTSRQYDDVLWSILGSD